MLEVLFIYFFFLYAVILMLSSVNTIVNGQKFVAFI